MNLPLSQVARWLNLPAPATDVTITGWSIDTRTLVPGDLFFALRGPNHDGHDHVAGALAAGAVAAIVERPLEGRTLQVADTQLALEQLAGAARQHWMAGAPDRTVIGVTGSAGKTSTKEVISTLLAAHIETSKTTGNFNNHIGLPLSVLRISDTARATVLEMGMNHAGEIRHLAQIAAPQIGVVTNVGTAHIENFANGIDGIAAAKRELVESLPATGTAVLNADDPRVSGFGAAFAGRTITFGLSEDADVRATGVELSLDEARFNVGSTHFSTVLTGRHSVRNVLAGIAVGQTLGIAPEEMVETVRSLRPAAMRGERFWHQGALIFNDCYNSNPDAARAMLDVLRDSPAERRIAVLGEMLELGSWTEPLHRDVGTYVAAQGIPVLIGIRGAARQMVEAAKLAGLSDRTALFFESPEEAGDFVRSMVKPGDAVLFKGSRGTRVERALERVVGSAAGGAH